jgi:hypothetical protein
MSLAALLNKLSAHLNAQVEKGKSLKTTPQKLAAELQMSEEGLLDALRVLGASGTWRYRAQEDGSLVVERL